MRKIKPVTWITAAILLFSLIHMLSFYFYTVEDAYISFRYARFFAEGEGLVYNPGEYVEGYTNFLWVVILGLLYAAGFPMIHAAKVLGMALGTFTVFLVMKKSKSLVHDEMKALVPGVLLGACSAFAVWCQAGLETPLFSCLLTAAVLRFADELQDDSRISFSGVLFGAAALTRPETLLYFPLLAAFFFIAGIIKKGSYLRPVKKTILVFLIIIFPFFLFRYHYYGDFLPNTYYVKSIRFKGNGFHYLKAALPYTGWITLPFFFYALFRKKNNLKILGSFMIVAAGTLYILYQGGDWMPMSRFFVPLAPFFFIVSAVGLVDFASKFNRKTAAGLIIIVMSFSAGIEIFSSSRGRDKLRWEYRRHKEWKKVGMLLADMSEPGDVMATGLGGIIPYYARLPNLDRGGLTNKKIAELISKAENYETERLEVAGHIISQKPKYILIPNFKQLWESPPSDFSFDADWRMLELNEFNENYVMKKKLIDDGWFCWYELKSSGQNRILLPEKPIESQKALPVISSE